MSFTPLPKALFKGAINYRGQRRALVREQFFRLAGRFTPLLVAEQDGLRFYVRTDDLGVGRVTFTDMSIERKTLEDAFACLEALGARRGAPGSGVFLDVGANIGTTSITAVAKQMVAGAVCVEPLPDNQGLLRRNAELNGVADRVRLLPYAASDREGEVVFEQSADNWGDGRVRVNGAAVEDTEDAFGEAERKTLEVPAATLDRLAERGEVEAEALALVWIDAQGHEAQILAGARGLLGSGVPVVAEFWPYGLRRAGGLERYCELAEELFAGFVDLGSVEDQAAPERRPIAQVAELTERYGGVEFTDLLLLA